MDKKKSLDLIKLEVLGCLSDKDRENLHAMKAKGEEFLWKELGNYQNLIALLPLVLEPKYPASDIKDKTAMKLYTIRDQIKAKIDARKAQEMPAETIEEIAESDEEIEIQESLNENITTEQIEVEEKEFAEIEEGIRFNAAESNSDKQEPIRFVNKYKEKTEPENLFRQAEVRETREPVKTTINKDAIEKVTREFLKTHLERELGVLRKSVNKNKILSFILFAITIVLIIAMFFIK